MASKLEFEDTFLQWRDKINNFVDEFNGYIIDEVLPGKFGYSAEDSSGLNAFITEGQIRDGSTVETVAGGQVTLLPNETNIVVVYKRTGDTPEFQVHPISDLPDRYVVPIASFTTNATSITNYVDLRTEFNTASGSTSNASGILMFDKIIDRDTVVPAEQNALSVSPTVEDGITVTVTEGSEWVVL